MSGGPIVERRWSGTASRWSAVFVLLAIGQFWAPAAGASEELWALLKKPGHIVLLRHSNAPSTPDGPLDSDVKDCTTQRNLDQKGREQAGRIGDAFRKRGIRKAALLSSQFCRARDTARLMKLGPVKPLPILNQVVLSHPIDLRNAGIKTRQYMKTIPAKQLTVLVSHVTNINSTAGVLLDSGEMAIVHLDKSGEVVVDGKIMVP